MATNLDCVIVVSFTCNTVYKLAYDRTYMQVNNVMALASFAASPSSVYTGLFPIVGTFRILWLLVSFSGINMSSRKFTAQESLLSIQAVVIDFFIFSLNFNKIMTRGSIVMIIMIIGM